MRVVLLASTRVTQQGYDLMEELGFDVPISATTIDTLHEFCGRTCYLSYPKPNPATARNEDYLANILDSQHESVVEHGVVSLYVDGVSRNLLLELERHRHLSFSVLSTRYVPARKMGNVIHPNTPERFISLIENQNENVRYTAEMIYTGCRAAGMDTKQAREVARQILPGSTETRFVVTGNIRAWRWVILKRNHPTADAEIQEFAHKVYEVMKSVAPNSMQDMEF